MEREPLLACEHYGVSRCSKEENPLIGRRCGPESLHAIQAGLVFKPIP